MIYNASTSVQTYLGLINQIHIYLQVWQIHTSEVIYYKVLDTKQYLVCTLGTEPHHHGIHVNAI